MTVYEVHLPIPLDYDDWHGLRLSPTVWLAWPPTMIHYGQLPPRGTCRLALYNGQFVLVPASEPATHAITVVRVGNPGPVWMGPGKRWNMVVADTDGDDRFRRIFPGQHYELLACPLPLWDALVERALSLRSKDAPPVTFATKEVIP